MQYTHDNLLSSYTYDLPKESIAQFPVERGQSRLCVVDKISASGHDNDPCSNVYHEHFDALLMALPKNALLVANNSRVLPTRLLGQRKTGGRLECLLLTPLPQISIEPSMHEALGECFSALVEVLLKPAKSLPVGTSFALIAQILFVDVLEKSDFGKHIVRFYFTASHFAAPHCEALHEETPKAYLESLLWKHGHLPLPPYIQREAQALDKESYQTSYAQHAGSIAAPTAGLHFTADMRKRLLEAGFDWAELTLHVGYGTFSPVRCEDIREHEMHPEHVELSAETAERIAKAKTDKRPIIAIGTTTARTLEAVCALHDGRLLPHTGYINIFIKPGFTFRMIDGLLTNFHLPESSLLMLVAALLGRERTLAIYAEAVSKGYRFFSYGDAMLIR